MNNLIKCFKELLINKSDKNHIYFFTFKVDNINLSISGYYVIDDQNQKWISVCAISSMIKENIYEKYRSKYFDINGDRQQQFYLIDANKFLENLDSEHEKSILIDLILCNKRQGTPRKFITCCNGEKVNIEMESKTINCKEFK